jgi:hypothetical protein
MDSPFRSPQRSLRQYEPSCNRKLIPGAHQLALTLSGTVSSRCLVFTRRILVDAWFSQIVVVPACLLNEFKSVTEVETIGIAVAKSANPKALCESICLRKDHGENCGSSASALVRRMYVEMVKQQLLLLVANDNETNSLAIGDDVTGANRIKPLNKTISRTRRVEAANPFKAFTHCKNADLGKGVNVFRFRAFKPGIIACHLTSGSYRFISKIWDRYTTNMLTPAVDCTPHGMAVLMRAKARPDRSIHSDCTSHAIRPSTGRTLSAEIELTLTMASFSTNSWRLFWASTNTHSTTDGTVLSSTNLVIWMTMVFMWTVPSKNGPCHGVSVNVQTFWF